MHQANSLIESAIGRPEVMRRIAAHRVTTRWEECVGQQLASKSAPEKFENGTLWVAATAPVWVQELRMRRDQILSRLNEWAGEELFTDVRFGVRPVEAAEIVEEPQPVERLVPEAVDIEFTIPELERVARPVLGKMKAARKRDK